MTEKEISKLVGVVLGKIRRSLLLDVIVFFILRCTLGLTKELIYLYTLFLFVLGISVETLTMAFFCIAIIVYIFGGWVEANNYFSYVYVGLVLSVVKYFYRAIKDRKSHQ